MNWHKFTLDEWLEQFGAWCDRQGRVTPNRLETNQIYHLMQSVHPTPKTVRYCCITDDEALAVNRVLCETAKILPFEIELLVKHKTQVVSIRNLASEYNLPKSAIHEKITNIRYYLAGFLKITP